MNSQDIGGKPIPALYAVYILRSTVRNTSLYVGSTPNPPRRLRQHNGEVGGGAVRTARYNLRPWEMAVILTGFPSKTGALQFEWALNNPHITKRIPDDMRISISTSRKKSGHPRPVRKSMSGILANIDVLVRAQSFARWPLKIRFFAQNVYEAWQRLQSKAEKPLEVIEAVTDFGPPPASQQNNGNDAPPSWGIHALPLTHDSIKEYVVKQKEIYDFEREGRCVVCKATLVHGKGLYATCPTSGCDGVGHLLCWSRHILAEEGVDSSQIVPVKGTCPRCKGLVLWVEMMKGLTLHLYGQQHITKLLQVKRKKGSKDEASGVEDNELDEPDDSTDTSEDCLN